MRRVRGGGGEAAAGGPAHAVHAACKPLAPPLLGGGLPAWGRTLTTSCCDRLWLTAVASSDSCCSPLMLSRSSGIWGVASADQEGGCGTCEPCQKLHGWRTRTAGSPKPLPDATWSPPPRRSSPGRARFR